MMPAGIGRFRLVRGIFVRDAALGSRGRLALLALFVVALIVLVPLRLVLGMVAPENVTARSVEGSVWQGRIADLAVGPLPLGTVSAGLDPLSLLLGRAQFSVAREGFSVRVAAGGGVRVSQATGSIVLPDGLGELPVASLGFGDFSMTMIDGKCREADGKMMLELASPGALLPGPITLSGKARCDKGALLVPMQGPQGMERLTLRIAGDGRWQADLALAGLPQETADALVAGGFDARPGGVGFGTSGSF